MNVVCKFGVNFYFFFFGILFKVLQSLRSLLVIVFVAFILIAPVGIENNKKEEKIGMQNAFLFIFVI